MRALGLDIGTTTLSAVVMDAHDGRVLRALTVPNDTCVQAEPWARLQDPRMIWRKSSEMLTELHRAFPGIRAIGLTGQMHGIVYVDHQGRAVSPLISWQDGRGKLATSDGRSYACLLSELTGYPLATGYGALSHAYNLMNGLVPEGAARFCTIQDYIGMCLTGRGAPLVHTSNAASFGAFDLKRGAFDFAALDCAGIDAMLFPEVTGTTTLLGEASADTLPSGIAVSVAIGDNQASFIGSVKQPEQSVLVNMGTGGQVSVAVDEYCVAEDCELRPLTDGKFLLVGFSLCGGRAYALLESFMRGIAVAAGAPDVPLYDVMNALVERADHCANRLRVCTQFSGTRNRPELRGSIQNIGTDNFTPQHLVRGVLEGMAEELYAPYLKMLPHMRQQPGKLIGSGNGMRQNAALRRAFADAFGMPLLMPQNTEEAAYGACLFAMAATGLYPSVSEAQANLIHSS